MSEALLGTTAQRELYYELAGRARTGAVLAYVLYDPTGASVATATTGAGSVVDNQDGWYSVAVSGSAFLLPGAYRELWTGTYTDVTAYNIREERQFLVVAQPDPKKTRRELRWDCAAALDDDQRGAMSSATSTTLVDNTLANVYNHDYFNGGELYIFAAGTGRYQSRRITDYEGDNGRFIVPTWTATPATGVLYEAHKPGKPTVEQYNRAINRAIEDAIEQGARLTATFQLTAFNDTVSDTWRAYQPYEYPLPAGLVYVGDAWVQDTNDSLLRWSPLAWQDRDSYWAADLELVSGRRLVRYVNAMAGQQLRLEGQFLPTYLDRDDWYTDVPAGWLTNRALMYLDARGIQSPALDRSAAAQRTGVWANATQSPSAVYVPPLVNGMRVI